MALHHFDNINYLTIKFSTFDKISFYVKVIFLKFYIYLKLPDYISFYTKLHQRSKASTKIIWSIKEDKLNNMSVEKMSRHLILHLFIVVLIYCPNKTWWYSMRNSDAPKFTSPGTSKRVTFFYGSRKLLLVETWFKFISQHLSTYYIR